MGVDWLSCDYWINKKRNKWILFNVNFIVAIVDGISPRSWHESFLYETAQLRNLTFMSFLFNKCPYTIFHREDKRKESWRIINLPRCNMKKFKSFTCNMSSTNLHYNASSSYGNISGNEPENCGNRYMTHPATDLLSDLLGNYRWNIY